MTMYKNIILDTLNEMQEASNKEILEEGIIETLRNILVGTTLAMSAIPTVQAKTDYERLHNAHNIVSKYESGKLGYDAITKDNYGGYSYGKWQISTERRNGRPSTFDFFLRYAKDNNPGIYTNLQKAGGQEGAYKGTQEFKDKWKKLTYRKDFRDLYDGFILNTQVVPVYDRMDSSKNSNLDKVTTWGSNDNAIQAAIKSAIIQHGPNGAYNIINSIMNGSTVPTTKEQFLKQLYTKRISKFPKYKNRYNNEYKDLKKYLDSGNSEIPIAYGKEPGQSGYELDQLIQKIANN